MDYSQGQALAKALGATIESLNDDNIAHGICVYWDNVIQLKDSLPLDRKLHILIHELCHLTGTECRLDRDTLLMYGKNELYALVEETIVEAATVALLTGLDALVYTVPLARLTQACDEQGIEWEIDVLPEVERIVEYLTPYIKEITHGA